MTALKIQQFAFVVISTFIATLTVMFGGTAVNFFELSWSTWQQIISAVVIGVLNYFIMWLAPQNKNFGLGAS